MKLFYVAHPFGGEAVNLVRARHWYRWLIESFGAGYSFTATWILECEMIEETSTQRELGLRRDEEVCDRCDGIILVGTHVSAGMLREANRFEDNRRIDLTVLGPTPAHVTAKGMNLASKRLSACPGPTVPRCQ